MASRKLQSENDTEVLPENKSRPAPPLRFKVLLHDDDFTTMDFVVTILRDVFSHSEEDATRIMLDVHRLGLGLAGVYPFEVAEAKAAKVIERARAQDFPFLASLEPADG